MGRRGQPPSQGAIPSGRPRRRRPRRTAEPTPHEQEVEPWDPGSWRSPEQHHTGSDRGSRGRSQNAGNGTAFPAGRGTRRPTGTGPERPFLRRRQGREAICGSQETRRRADELKQQREQQTRKHAAAKTARQRDVRTPNNNMLAQGPEERKRLHAELVTENGELGLVTFLRALTGLMRIS